VYVSDILDSMDRMVSISGSRCGCMTSGPIDPTRSTVERLALISLKGADFGDPA